MQRQSYLLRCTPPFSIFIEYFVSFDSSLLQMFGHLLSLGSFDRQKRPLDHKQAYLPTIFGGINFILITTIALTSYLRSCAFITSIIIVRFMVDQHPFLLEAFTWVDNKTFLFQQHLKATCSLLSPPPHVCHLPFEQLIKQQMVWLQDSILKRLHHLTFFSMFFDKIFETQHVRILSCFGLKACTWLIVWPTFLTFQFFSPSFSIAFRTRLGLPHPSITYIFWCMCTHPIDVSFVLLLHCTHGNECIGTHDAICDTFVAIHEMSTSLWDENNYTHFFQPCCIPFVDELTLCSPKMEFSP
jgi:hypothetical protein